MSQEFWREQNERFRFNARRAQLEQEITRFENKLRNACSIDRKMRYGRKLNKAKVALAALVLTEG